MTRRHDESLTISMQILSEAGYTHARSNVEEIATLVRSLSSGRGVYVPREEIEGLAYEIETDITPESTRDYNALNRLAARFRRWLSGSPTPTEDARP
jgi:hypothetical protein